VVHLAGRGDRSLSGIGFGPVPVRAFVFLTDSNEREASEMATLILRSDGRFIQIPECDEERDKEMEALSDDQIKQLFARTLASIKSANTDIMETAVHVMSVVKAIDRELARRGKEDLLQEFAEAGATSKEDEK
jgi:hypothetical protein